MSDHDEESEDLLSYEEQRLATIRSNAELLASLGLQAVAPPTPAKGNGGTLKIAKRPKSEPTQAITPTRRSARIEKAATEHLKLPDDWNDTDDRPSKRKRIEVTLPKLPKVRIPAVTAVRYAEEANEEYYDIRQPIPGRTTDGTERIIFEGRWKGVFEPNLTPEEVFRRGAFGGNYYADDYSNVLKRPLHSAEDLAELPSSWFEQPDPIVSATHLTAPVRDPSVNRYGVHAGQGLREWEKSGWIWEGDPRGWMQWYMRFYYGRRCPDDLRQVQRWLNLAGPSGRFARALVKKIAQHPGGGGMTAVSTALDDEDVGRVLRQVNHQWAWQLTRAEWQRRILQ